MQIPFPVTSSVPAAKYPLLRPCFCRAWYGIVQNTLQDEDQDFLNRFYNSKVFPFFLLAPFYCYKQHSLYFFLLDELQESEVVCLAFLLFLLMKDDPASNS
ncbi:hypothetical protein J6590_069578 [Homalodisca vitripennis]|nr:hypothetical protein J6590_069578 [Homalodisca vitripennis]